MRNTDFAQAWILGPALVAAWMALCPSALAGACDADQAPPLIAPEAAKLDQFGTSVSISGNTAIVGAVGGAPFGAAGPGTAYLFVASGSKWTLQAALNANDASKGDSFGAAVAISGETAVIGAPGDDWPGGSGSAYVFVRNGTVWTQQAKLTAADAPMGGGSFFGTEVSVSGDTAMVGAYGDDEFSGAAYVFVRNGTTWSQQTKLTAADGAAYDFFGRAVSIHGDTAVAGAYRAADRDGDIAGAAYVFVRSGAAWSQQSKLMATDPAEGDAFGASVSVNGDTIAVGAYHDGEAVDDSGLAYVFVRSAVTWSLQAQLSAANTAAGDLFGSVSISGDWLLVGAIGTDGEGIGSGSAYLFTRTDAIWTQQAELTASDAAFADQFGAEVSIEGDAAIVGVPFHDTAGKQSSGAAYVFLLACTTGIPADLSGDGTVNGIDLAMLLAAWGACPRGSGCPADLDGNGIVNGMDLAMLLAAWG